MIELIEEGDEPNYTNLYEGASLEQAGRIWDNVIKSDGGDCPVCDRWGKVYKRNINVTMAKGLIWLNNQTGDADGWVHLPSTAPKWLLASNQLSTLHWWNLVERKSKDESHKAKFSGIWRTTPQGAAFASGKISIPKSVYTYNNRVIQFDDAHVYIRDCFDEVFDYELTMQESLNGRNT